MPWRTFVQRVSDRIGRLPVRTWVVAVLVVAVTLAALATLDDEGSQLTDRSSSVMTDPPAEGALAAPSPHEDSTEATETAIDTDPTAQVSADSHPNVESAPSGTQPPQLESNLIDPTGAMPVSFALSNSLAVQRQFGVATASNGWNRSEIQAAAASAGHDPSIVLHYLSFTDELQREQLQNVAGLGAMSLLTWEPWDHRVGTVNQPTFALRRIIAGDFDAYILRTARTLRDFQRPVLVNFAHEMNGDWYPWAERVNGNRLGEYVAAYRHIHNLVASTGANNVTWVWNPNVEYPGSQSLTGLYPGHNYVDVIGVNGYNFGTSQSWSSWQNPSQLFGSTLSKVRGLAPGKPLMIGETSSSETGGNKATWISDLFSWLNTQSDVQAVVWFNLNKETDWRINSSAASARAFPPSLSSWLLPAGMALSNTVACEGAASNQFTDSNPTHQANINCIAAYDVVNGFADGTFGGSRSITRAQMATFIANFAAVAQNKNIAEIPIASHSFTDVAGNVHANNIARIYGLAITKGRTATTFAPNDTITRAEAAKMLYNAHIALGVSFAAVTPSTAFTDLGDNVHAANINLLAGAGVVNGKTATTFGPTMSISRAEAATLLVNSIDVLDGQGKWHTPAVSR